VPVQFGAKLGSNARIQSSRRPSFTALELREMMIADAEFSATLAFSILQRLGHVMYM